MSYSIKISQIMSRFFKISTIATAIFLTACGSPTDPSKDNFKTAIQAFLDTKGGVCVDVPAQSVPFKLELNNPISHNGVVLAEALVDAGLLNKQDAQVKAPFDGGVRPGREYNVTSAGSAYLVKPKSYAMGARDSFCTGKYKILEVGEFTEPRTMDGKVMTQVNFSYSVSDRADWSETPSLQAAHRVLRENSAAQLKQKAVLIQTDSGWVHEMLYSW
ncbi:hypothetical protein KXJ72_18185 (plasmid) [Comamonas aquatica]|nr:hypothetical protein KXJ72_18185 [Comamonas aquatica]